jgi:hypothetical protein
MAKLINFEQIHAHGAGIAAIQSEIFHILKFSCTLVISNSLFIRLLFTTDFLVFSIFL